MISSSLFHYTTYENLIQIVKGQKFIPGYNYEPIFDLGFPSYNYLLAPMICFCDIPLSFVVPDKFGEKKNFGIAMSKNWRDRYDINPIMYRRIDSNYTSIFKEKINTIEKLEQNIRILFEEEKKAKDDKKKKASEGTHDAKVEDEVLRILRVNENLFKLTDRLKELFIREILLTNNISYYSEREWRYVDSSQLTLTNEKSNNHSSKKKALNKNLSQDKKVQTLGFEFSDINHLVVPTNEDSKRLIDEIIGHDEIDQKNELISKIISIETVNTDL